MLKRLTDFPRKDLNPNIQMRGRLLNTLLIGLISAVFVTDIFLISATYTDFMQFDSILYFSSFLIILGGLISYWLNKKGKVYFAGSIFLFLVAAVVTISDTPKELLVGRSMIFFIIPVIMSSFLIRSYASFIVAALLTIEHTVLWITADLDITFNPFGMIAFFNFAYIAWLGARAMEDALTQAYNTNQHLDELVGARTRELAEANAYLESANERLTELDALKSKFVSDVSHELRTPISNISIYLEMLEQILSEIKSLPKRTRKFIKILRDETERLTKLITDVLNTSRLEQAIDSIEMRPINVCAIVADVVEANRLKAETKGITLSLSEPDSYPNLLADPDQLKQVFTNLVANAINYTPKGEVNISTQIDEANQYIFRIQDTGMGISSSDTEHLFERFYRGQQASRSSIPGTGLGLAITKEIVEAHNGRIKVESEINVGTTFTVYFPIYNPNNEE